MYELKRCPLSHDQIQAYEWAKNQDYPSVGARYAKILAETIDQLQAGLDRRADGWISDRNPVESDADENGNVPVILPNGMMLFYKWSYVRVECGDSWIPYQKPLPEPPKGAKP